MGLWSPAAAQIVVRPTSVLSATAATDLFPAVNLVNGSGLSAVPDALPLAGITHSSATSTTAWATAGDTADWYAVPKPPPVLTFTLPGPFLLTGLTVWGYPSGTSTQNHEAKELLIEFSTVAGGKWDGAVTLTHARTGRAPETLVLPDRVARFVRITVTDNYFGTPGATGGQRVGLGEIRFLGTPVTIPDPVMVTDRSLLSFTQPSAVAQPVTQSLEIRNAGPDHPLRLTSVALRGPDASLFSLGSIPSTIAAGTISPLIVTFDAGGRTGRFSAWLQVDSNDPARPQVDVALLASSAASEMPPPPPPDLSPAPGTFTDDFSLRLTPAARGGLIMITTDGSTPGPDNGQPVTGPLNINRTTLVRAITLVDGGASSPVVSAAYIKLAAALHQKSSPLPLMVIENFGAGKVPDKGWTTSTQTGAGLRQRPRQPVVMSLHDRDPATRRARLSSPASQHARAGLRVRGAFSSTWSPQPYALDFWDEENREQAVAPLGMPRGEDWVLYHPHPSYDTTMIFNSFIWELSRRTGRYAPAFRYVEVYLNENGGDLDPSDRRGLYLLVEAVKRAVHRVDFEPLSADGSTGGWMHSINRMDPQPEDGWPAPNGARSPQFFRTPGPNRLRQTTANQPAQIGDDLPKQYNAFINFENPGGYTITAMQRNAIESWFQEFENVLYDNTLWRDPVKGYRQYLNTKDFIDYFQLLNLARQGDGLLLSLYPWVSSGQRRLHMGPLWDFNNGSYHLSGSPNSIPYFRQDQLWYPRLFADPDFMREYVDRWFELRRGPYANASLRAIADEQAAAITTEVANAQGVSTSSWTSSLNAMKNFLVQRADWIDTRYIRPPDFSIAPGFHPAPISLSVSQPATVTGTVYVTADGRDPRAASGAPQGTPATELLTLQASTLIKARTLTTTGAWSALNTGYFIIHTPATAENTVISEIHYNPPGSDDAGEFVEIMNTSDRVIDFTGARFDRGLEYAFDVGSTLAAGKRAILVARRSDFPATEGPKILGEFGPSPALGNGGGLLRLRAWDDTVIVECPWDDKAPWPRSPDGNGPSLTLIRPEQRPHPSDPRHWRASLVRGGTPGFTDATAFSGQPAGGNNVEGLPDVMAYALGLDLPASGQRTPQLFEENGQLVWLVPSNPAAEDMALTCEWSPDMKTWVSADPFFPEYSQNDDESGRRWHRRVSSPSMAGTTGFLRLRAHPR